MPRTRVKAGGGDVATTATIIGVPGSNYIEFALTEGHAILCGGEDMIYTKGNIGKSEVQLQGIIKSVARFFSNEEVFLEKYTGPGIVAVGSSIPGDIIMITLQPGESFILSRSSFLACTANVEVSAGFRLRGVIGVGQEEGFVLPTVTCPENSEQPGFVWVAAYGTFKKHVIKAGDSILVNNGMFLACNEKIKYELETAGRSIIGSLVSGGLGMKFVGPCEIYTQSKNLNILADTISMLTGSSAPSSSSSTNTNGNNENASENVSEEEVINEEVVGGRKHKNKRKSRKK